MPGGLGDNTLESYMVVLAQVKNTKLKNLSLFDKVRLLFYFMDLDND